MGTPIKPITTDRSIWSGLLASGIAVAATTLAILPLREVAPEISVGVVYMLPVLAVSIFWDIRIGLLTAVFSAVSFNLFYIEPTGTLSVNSTENLIALFVFLIAAAITSTLAEVSRQQAREANRRRLEADITARMTRILLSGSETSDVLPRASAELAEQLGLAWVTIAIGSANADAEIELKLELGKGRLGHLELSPEVDPQLISWVQNRIAPSIEAIMRAALERDRLQEGVIETKALRRSDVLKTALIQSVSHDLRSPLAAILTSAEAMKSPGLDDSEMGEMVDAVSLEATRLSRLVNNLLDLSRLESGAADPRLDWAALDEVIDTAVEEARRRRPDVAVRTSVEHELGLYKVDPVQIERSLVNLIENAQRYSDPEPVTVSLRADRGTAVIRVVDRGPGIATQDLERVFRPFEQVGDSRSHQGSGLGLAIARGFVEANGGTVRAESLPGQGTAFVVEIPDSGEAPG